MSGLALQASQGLVPGILTYGVLRASYFLFVEKMEKLEKPFEIFKSNVKEPLEKWNQQHSQSAQISYSDALRETGALKPSEMQTRVCCRNSKQSIGNQTCQQLKKQMEDYSTQCVSSWRPVAWSIVAGAVGSIVLASIFTPRQVKASGLFSRLFYRSITTIGCLVAGGKILRQFNDQIEGFGKENKIL